MEMVAVALEIEREKSFAPAKPKRLPTDTKPQPFITQVPLIDVFERLKRVKADIWQRDFCNRLQEATENRHVKGIRALVHAQPQLGKSIILGHSHNEFIAGSDFIGCNISFVLDKDSVVGRASKISSVCCADFNNDICFYFLYRFDFP